jgi:hypothetical protein
MGLRYLTKAKRITYSHICTVTAALRNPATVGRSDLCNGVCDGLIFSTARGANRCAEQISLRATC